MSCFLQILTLLIAGLVGIPASGAPTDGMALRPDVDRQAAKDGTVSLSDVNAGPQGRLQDRSQDRSQGRSQGGLQHWLLGIPAASATADHAGNSTTSGFSKAPAPDSDGSDRWREQEEVEDEEENDEDEAGMSKWLFAALRADAIRAGPTSEVHASRLRSGAVRTRGPPLG